MTLGPWDDECDVRASVAAYDGLADAARAAGASLEEVATAMSKLFGVPLEAMLSSPPGTVFRAVPAPPPPGRAISFTEEF